MKKFRIVIATLVFSLLFAGTAFAADKATLSNSAARHLIEKSNEAMEGITSFKMYGLMDMIMNMEIAGETEIADASVFFEGIVDLPKGMYVNYGMVMGMDEEEVPMSMEMLIDENGIFMKMPGMIDEWEAVADAGSTELMAMALSGDTTMAEEMLAEMGLDVVALEDKIYRNASYTRNVKILDKSYYVVDISFDIKTLVKEMTSYMESIYIAQEAEMYEGFAEEAMFMMNMLTEKISGNAEMSMYIETDTYNLSHFNLVLDLDMDIEELLGVKMDVFIDAFVMYSDYGSKNLVLPVVEIAPSVVVEEVEAEVVEEVELEEVVDAELVEVDETDEVEEAEELAPVQ